MYSWEIAKFLKDRNYYIGGDDLLFILDTRQHPQINHIIFNPYDNSYDMWDENGEHFHFTAMNRKEAEEKGLVKNIKGKEKNDDWER